jgi:gluconate 5-dehydrogenase
MTDLFSVKGKIAVVTGGSRGIGLMIARGLVDAGARVYISSRKAGVCDEVAAELSTHGECFSIPADLGTLEGLDHLANRLGERESSLHILVNNAGATWGAATLEHPLDAWQKVVNLNLTATFLMCQEVGRRCMVPRRRGRIVNIASILGLTGGGDPGRPATLAYNTTKGGVVNFTRSLAAEWAQYDITVNAIAPGFFPTKMTKGLMEMLGDGVAERAPLKRLGGPEDLKGLIVVLASDASAFITGQIIAVDGGVTAM